MSNDVDQKMDLIEKNDKKIEALAAALNIPGKTVFNALFMLWSDKYAMWWAAELWDIDIDFTEAYNDLKKVDFTLFESDILSDYAIIEDIKLMERKALVKAAGAIWKINLYDSDPFPSNPHAHNLEENIKLDLSNGNCYRKRELLKTIRKKDLLKIREQAAHRLKTALPELAC